MQYFVYFLNIFTPNRYKVLQVTVYNLFYAQKFLAIKIWHEYCQYMMNNIESPADIERARNVFERAITSVGLHVTEVVKLTKCVLLESLSLQVNFLVLEY